MSNVISQEGLEKLKKELDEIKNIKLKEVAVRIKEAKDLGDLSENAEYHEAKNEQAFLYGKALDLEQKIKNAKVISKNLDLSTVVPGCTVDVSCGGERTTFEMVGSEESDPMNGKISIESPIGAALSGRKVGEIATALTPAGEREYKIINIT